jgi:hypothetical protein
MTDLLKHPLMAKKRDETPRINTKVGKTEAFSEGTDQEYAWAWIANYNALTGESKWKLGHALLLLKKGRKYWKRFCNSTVDLTGYSYQQCNRFMNLAKSYKYYEEITEVGWSTALQLSGASSHAKGNGKGKGKAGTCNKEAGTTTGEQPKEDAPAPQATQTVEVEEEDWGKDIDNEHAETETHPIEKRESEIGRLPNKQQWQRIRALIRNALVFVKDHHECQALDALELLDKLAEDIGE